MEDFLLLTSTVHNELKASVWPKEKNYLKQAREFTNRKESDMGWNNKSQIYWKMLQTQD